MRSNGPRSPLTRGGARRILTARRLAWGLLATSLSLAAWSVIIEPRGLRMERIDVGLAGLPEACRGLRIAAIADLHVGSPFNGIERLQGLVARVLAEEPDLILLLGDYVIQGVLGGSFVPPEETAKVLSSLHAPLGVFAVLGNHDWWLDGARVATALSDESIRVLEDEAVPLSRADCSLWLVGIGDFWEGAHDVGLALASVPEGESVIAFTHNPDVFPDVPSKVSLTLAGHTHGGQVRLPWIGAPIVPSDFGQRYAAGLIREAGRDLFVSTGVGTSILPLRLGVPPVVSILRLTVL